MKGKVKPNIPKEHRAQIKLPDFEWKYVWLVLAIQLLAALIILKLQ